MLDLKKAHEQALSALELSSTQSSHQSQMTKQLVELKESHLREIRQLEAERQSMQKKLGQQVDTLTKDVQELELKLSLEVRSREKVESELASKQGQWDEDRVRLERLVKETEQTRFKYFKENESRLNQRVREMEEQLEEYKSKTHREGNQQQEDVE